MHTNDRDSKDGDTLSSRHVSSLCYACSCDVRGDLTLNSTTRIHTSVNLLTSRDLTRHGDHASRSVCDHRNM